VQTLNNAIQWWAKNTPDMMVLSIGGEGVTYREYHDWSERIAARLIADGVSVGDRVGICAANSFEYCALIMGVIRAGAIVSPLNIRYTAYEIKEILEDTTPRFVYADEERLPKFVELGVPTRNLSEVASLRHGTSAHVDRTLNPDLPVVIISTSGSTAKPKGVVFTHRTMSSYVSGFALEESGIASGGRVIVVAPLSTSAGFVQLIHYSLMGCTLYLEPVFVPECFLEILVNDRINGFAAVPTFFERIAACAGFADADLSNLTVATTGGARVSRALQDTWAAKGVIIRQIYGQTEAGGNATIMPANLAAQYPEKCGRGGIFTELAIIDSNGDRLPPGTPGEILIRGPGTMIGYWNNPEATAATIKDGWLHTGDLGVLDADGMLTFVDRIKDIIISGGLNISAAEVERCLCEFAGVEEAAVIAASDAKFGETPLAIIYGTQPIDGKKLIEHCNTRLADYKVPRYLIIEPEPLPRLATQKISKPALRAKYKDAASQLERVR
jgi:fatty-acyl-CoA synthase